MGRKKKFSSKKTKDETVFEHQTRIENQIKKNKLARKKARTFEKIKCPEKDCVVYLNVDLNRHPVEWYQSVINKHIDKKHPIGVIDR